MTKYIKQTLILPFLLSLFLLAGYPSTSLSQNVNTYEKAISKADQLFQNGKLMDAKGYYQMALKFKKDDSYAKKQINKIIQKLSSQMEQEDIYYELIDKADLYFDENALEKALSYYEQALKVIPDDDYAKEQIKKIREIEKNEREKREQYQRLINEGDELVYRKKFDEAIEKYSEAQHLFPQKADPDNKIKTAVQLKQDYQEKVASFNEKTEEAQRYLLINKFSDALKAYQEAQKLFPDNQDVAEKIKELTPKAKNQLAYENLVEEADQLYISKNYAAAKEKYQAASKLWPENHYAADMAQRIDEQLAEQMKDLEKNYRLAVSSGDSLFRLEDYESAKAQYNLALTLKPQDQYAKSKLEIITGIYQKRKAEMQQQYATILRNADSLFTADHLDQAKKQYELALSIRPEDSYPTTQLKKIEEKAAVLAEQQKQRMKYDAIIADADKLYRDGHFELAIKKYQEAQVFGAISDYPEARIKEIKQVMADAQKAKEINESYNRQMMLASKLKQEGKWEEAKKAFAAAAEIKPAEPTPKEQIKEIEQLIQARKEQELLDQKYAAALKKGEELMNAKNWEEAIGQFQLASNLKPEETLPKTKITKIKTIQANIQRAAQQQKAYDQFIAQGDSLLKAQKYNESKVQYKQALDLKPNEKYPREKIAFIEQKLLELAALKEKQFKEYQTKADNFYEQGNYQDALLNYKNALRLKTQNEHCLQRAEECNNLIEEINKKRKAQYDLAIADADKLFAAKIYDKAIKNYRKALQILPDQSYPAEMIGKITKYIDENSIVDVIKEPVVIAKGENKKYTFEPVPINVRKHNYFLLKAKSKSGKPVKLMITYGSDHGKNGGFVINLQGNDQTNDYLIRVGNQYKWFSDDNNWISILPQTGDVEISLLRISKLN